ncbi:glycoside hydrolase family 5 protein [Paenibacillus sp. GCM10012307]|uniref:Exo-1,3-beta-glucanase D n=1 Tax=Paenibacillus roseus TaxID=2798579 RepID=A0A934JBV8_9BACL|nr:cellulase family glycosylhydrolase [Paenibacillus roseus]MBJ6363958.1 glycoside hydrolase family 5 protein [Paenibacillus roseus]
MYKDQGRVQGFLRANGEQIVNGDGEPLLLRGVGLGNWMLPEGYMWKFFKGADRPRRIEKLISDLIGETNAEQFWKRFHDDYITEADIRKMAEEGLNSVRLAINSRHIIEDDEPLRWKADRIGRIDRLIEWCRDYQLYVILDLHGAPGGQTGANIDDSEQDQPGLFQSEEMRERTIRLWRMLAERYKDEWIVGGYDLLNEPLPEWFNRYNEQVMPLYRDITKAIREVDASHMIIIEGVHWANDWSIFTEKFDDNTMLQFHKYWSAVDTASIQRFLDKRKEWNAPIYMGEGGENCWNWYVGAFGLFEDHNISWNFWPWKKLDNRNSPCSINRPDDWDLIIAYAQGEGPKPEPEKAQAILDQYLDNIRFDNCLYSPEVLRSAQRKLPLRIPAEYYGNQGAGIDHYAVSEVAEGSLFRQHDGLLIQFVHGESDKKPSFSSHGHVQQIEEEKLSVRLNEGEWVRYRVYSETDESYSIRVHALFQDANGSLTVRLNGQPLGEAAPNAGNLAFPQPGDGKIPAAFSPVPSNGSKTTEDEVASSRIDGSSLALDDSDGGDTTAPEAAADSPASWIVYEIAKSQLLHTGRHELHVEAAVGSVKLDWIEVVKC